MTKQVQAAELTYAIAKQLYLPKKPLTNDRLITLDRRLRIIENYLLRIIEAKQATQH